MTEAKRCECCGEAVATTAWYSGRGASEHYKDVWKAPLCKVCDTSNPREAAERIRSRRLAAAEKGEVVKERIVRPRELDQCSGGDGKPVHVGDTARDPDGREAIVTCINDVYGDGVPRVWADWDGDGRQSFWQHSDVTTVRHASPAAQQPEAGKQFKDGDVVCLFEGGGQYKVERWLGGVSYDVTNLQSGERVANQNLHSFFVVGSRAKTPGGSAEPAHGNTAVAAPSGSVDDDPAQPPGLSFPSYPENPAYAIAAPREAEVVVPNAGLSAFDEFKAELGRYVGEQLPKGVRLVCDRVYPRNPPTGDQGFRYAVWVVAEDGREVTSWHFMGIEYDRMRSMLGDIAARLMAAAAEWRGR